MRSSNKSAAIRHSVQTIVDSPKVCPGGSIRDAVKNLLGDVVAALVARTKRCEAELVRAGAEHLDAIPYLTKQEEAALRGLISLYKATVVEDHEANTPPPINMSGLPLEKLRGLLTAPAEVRVIDVPRVQEKAL